MTLQSKVPPPTSEPAGISAIDANRVVRRAGNPSQDQEHMFSVTLAILRKRIDLICVVSRRFSGEGTGYLIIDLPMFQILAFETNDCFE